MKDYYKILGLSPQSEPDKIRQQYRTLVVGCHPDKFSDPARKAQAEERVKEVNEAYAVLSDPTKRARYDSQRAARRAVRRPSPRAYPASASSVAPPVIPVDSDFFSPAGDRLDHLHYAFEAVRGDLVEVDLDRDANVLLLDDLNYARYRVGRSFRYLGGYARYTPVRLPVLASGSWHLVIDLGGLSGQVRSAARLVQRGYWW